MSHRKKSKDERSESGEPEPWENGMSSEATSGKDGGRLIVEYDPFPERKTRQVSEKSKAAARPDRIWALTFNRVSHGSKTPRCVEA